MSFLKYTVIILLLLLSVSNEADGKGHVLFKEGETDYKIYVTSTKDEITQCASKELQYWLKKISGIEIPITTYQNTDSSKKIIVGPCGDKSVKELAHQSLEEDAYFYKNSGDDIIICGSGRGLMYGVYGFLRNEFNCRWFALDCESIPHKDEYTFDELNFHSVPAFQLREVFYFNAWHPQWRIRNGLNQMHAFPPREPRKIVGGSYIFCGSHTFNLFVPKEKYFDTHPEYFSLVDGKRYSGGSQLCLSNPDVLRLCTDGMINYISQNPDYYAYSLSQNDCYRPCECDECHKLLEKYKTQSGVLIWFVNQVADVVKKKYPGKFISTYAYQYTKRAPQNITPRDNVIIELCDIDDCCVHGWENCEENGDFLQALKEWTAISPNVYVYDYVSNYMEYFLPVPNFHVFQSKLEKCKKLGCKGLRIYGVNLEPDGEFAALKTYVLSQLLWNPNQDVNALVSEFILAYYGSSANYVKEYYNLLQSSVKKDVHMHNDDSFDHPMYDDVLIEKMMEILSKAKSAADNQEVRNRVEVLQLSPAYLMCRKHPEKARKDGSYELIHRVSERDNMSRMGERVTNEKFEQIMTQSSAIKPTESNGSILIFIISILSGLFVLNRSCLKKNHNVNE